jgi:hypothetical protein
LLVASVRRGAKNAVEPDQVREETDMRAMNIKLLAVAALVLSQMPAFAAETILMGTTDVSRFVDPEIVELAKQVK